MISTAKFAAPVAPPASLLDLSFQIPSWPLIEQLSPGTFFVAGNRQTVLDWGYGGQWIPCRILCALAIPATALEFDRAPSHP
jgi:hypothetical protein